MKKFSAIIFDMDGVIVDSEERHERAFLNVVREIGYGDRLALRFADYIGRSDQVLWVDFVARHKPPQTVKELLVMKRGIAVASPRARRGASAAQCQLAPAVEGRPTDCRRLSCACNL